MASKGIIGIGIVIIIVVIAGAFLLVGNKGTLNNAKVVSNNNSTTVNNVVTSVGQGPSTISTTTVGTGSGSVYLSQGQFENLSGMTGRYNVTSYVGAAFAKKLNESKANTTLTVNYTYLQNATGEWTILYQNQTNHIGFSEIVIETTSPKIALKFFSGTFASKYNITNATMNGMVYNYIGTNAPYNSSVLLGYKGNYMTMFLVIGKEIPASELASAIASDIPG